MRISLIWRDTFELGEVMNSQRLTHNELAIVEQWLSHAENISPPITEILTRAITHLSRL